MNKAYFLGIFRISVLFAFIFFITNCSDFSINKVSPPAPSDEEIKQVSKRLPPPSFPDSITNTTPADYNWSVKDLQGNSAQASSWKNKVVLLNMWATWCGPCVAEMPSLQSLYEKTKDDGVIFVLVSNEDQSTVNEFVKKRNFSLPVFTISENLPSAFSSDAIPKTFIISPSGKIVFEHLGGANWDTEEAIKFLKSAAQLK